MSEQVKPVVVAFDGSVESQAAVTTAAGLFADRTLLVVSVWEAGLAVTAATWRDATLDGAPVMPSPETVAVVDHREAENASSVAEAGARLARSAGATAQALAVEDDVGDVARAVEDLAAEHHAAVLVVGSRGLGAVKARLMGSTSRRLLHDAQRPVLVVRHPA
jgi:nucleotide-binding universal stress UspA family protein